MGILDLFDDGDVVELNVEVLVDALEGAADLDVVFEFDGDGCVDECFEEAVRVLGSDNRRLTSHHSSLIPHSWRL